MFSNSSDLEASLRNGTRGLEHAPELLLNAIAGQRYRVIYLTYDDELAGDKVCFRAAPDCAARFRKERVFGDSGGPWLFEPSATPPERWWAERHMRENTTDLIAHAYVALGISPDHIVLFDGPPPANVRGENPYHGSTVRLQEYQPQWLTMYGSAAAS